MVRKSLVAVLVGALVWGGGPSPAAWASADLKLSPVTPWNLDGTDSGCALRRAFGTADRPVTLEFRRFRPGDGFQLVIDGADLAGVVDRAKVTVEFGTVFTDKDTPFQAGVSKRDDRKPIPSIFLSSAFAQPDKALPGETSSRLLVTPAMESEVKQVALVWGSNRLALLTGSLGKPFAALRSCTDALVASWGLDPAVQNALTRSAKPVSLMAMVRSIQASYPVVMAASGKQGRVNFRALVDAQGAVTQCATMRSYNNAAFDDLACKVVRKTKFAPALDKEGKPVASFYVETVSYTLG